MMYRITLTKVELQALAGLIDAGLRATGIAAARDAAMIVSRLDAAEEIPAPPTPNEGIPNE